MDNLFIFIIIMAKFAVPKEYQQTALMVGIVLALIMRGIFIAVGAAAINQFSWIFYIFGRSSSTPRSSSPRRAPSDDDEYEENRIIKWVEKRAPGDQGVPRREAVDPGERQAPDHPDVHRDAGARHHRPAVRARLDPSDLRPHQEPYLVLTANIFALMGLRQLYFLLGGLLTRLIFLGYGLAFLLGFIGVKLVLHAMHENKLPFINGGEHIEWAPDIPTLLSLGGDHRHAGGHHGGQPGGLERPGVEARPARRDERRCSDIGGRRSYDAK